MLSSTPMRQIDPAHINQDGPTSVNFRPLPKDMGRLSVDHGEGLDPLTSFNRAIENEMRSAGVMSVCPDVISDLDMAVIPDPVSAPPLNVANPDHCLVEFPEPPKRWKNIGQRLKLAAKWLHQAPDESS